jgi:hypothetical protein
MRSPVTRTWVARAVLAVVAALVVNLALSELGLEHDAPLVALLVVTSVAAGVLALQALESQTRLQWLAPNPAARADPGEDVGTSAFRHLVEAHETSRQVDDAVLWQIADLAARRLRQVHGLRWADDPARVTELVGPFLAELLSRDRRHRYQPDQRHHRYTVAELGELVGRIEAL